MNKYIKIKMTPTKYGVGGSFITEANFILDNLSVPFNKIPVKIDTGCSISTIPLRKLRVSERMCNILKEYDINENVMSYLSYGVETGGEKHDIPLTFKQKMECPALKFVHKISEFTISGVKIESNNICLNYNRSGNILIGMDILKDWDIHIGTTNDNETFFMACPKDKLNVEYYNELNRLFGTIQG
jgi:hypothetical protein